MRRTTLHGTTILAAAVLLLMGCGTDNDAGQGNAGGRSSTVSPSPTPSTPAGPSTSPGACTSQVQLNADDSGRIICLTRGGQVRITLDGTKERPWKPVAISGSGVLRPINAGIVVMPGDANVAYEAIASGTATLTSSRPLCASPTAPGQVSCMGIQEWTVTVRVR
ncbi:hypothetical protein [Streptomyces brasiliensis]|uniref:Lipoprotein n=1 Tax=Streptomyces brasiliensis TaxID=1954 RepID=A0A917NQ74_9ACTN|nr:hypothetical protein [Streptomyces brasiliensis]GGJ17953.1 hypothetical protein GCM10010121_031090 [Streptomyces brasiliensis]